MARQRLGKKKVKKLAEDTGLDVVNVFVRGGTDHRKDLLLSSGYVVYLYKSGEIEKSDCKWMI